MSEFKFAHRVVKNGDSGGDINLADTSFFTVNAKSKDGTPVTHTSKTLTLRSNTNQTSKTYVAAIDKRLHYSQTLYPLFTGIEVSITGSSGYFFINTVNPVWVADYIKNIYFFDSFAMYGKNLDLRIGFEGSTKDTAQDQGGIELYYGSPYLFGGYTGYSNTIGLSMYDYTDDTGRLIKGLPDLKTLYNNGGKTRLHIWLEEGKGNYFFDDSIDDTRFQDIEFTLPIEKLNLSSDGSGSGGAQPLAYTPTASVNDCLALLYQYNNSYISGNLYVKYTDGTEHNVTFDNMILEIGGGITYGSYGYQTTDGVVPTASDFDIQIAQRAKGIRTLYIHSNKYSSMSNQYNTIEKISGTIYGLKSCEPAVTNSRPQQM